MILREYEAVPKSIAVVTSGHQSICHLIFMFVPDNMGDGPCCYLWENAFAGRHYQEKTLPQEE